MYVLCIVIYRYVCNLSNMLHTVDIEGNDVLSLRSLLEVEERMWSSGCF